LESNLGNRGKYVVNYQAKTPSKAVADSEIQDVLEAPSGRRSARAPLTASAFILAMASITSCTNRGFPIDRESCRGWGDSIWDRCWWYNNAWVLGYGIVVAIYAAGFVFFMRKDDEKKTGCATPIYYYVGFPLMLISGLLVTQLIESLLEKG